MGKLFNSHCLAIVSVEMWGLCSEPQKLDTIESVYYNKSPERSHNNEKKI